MDLGFLRDVALAVLGFVLSGIGVVLLRRYVPLLQGRQELLLLRALAEMAVAAVEQVGKDRGLSGPEKKILAISLIRDGLGRLGIQVSEGEIEAAIEATVRSLEDA